MTSETRGSSRRGHRALYGGRVSVDQPMTCTICSGAIVATAPAILLNIGLGDRQRGSERFTGVAWHPGCAPVDREHLVAEARALLARPEVKAWAGR